MTGMSEPHTIVPQLIITTPVSSLATARAIAHAFLEERSEDLVWFRITYRRRDNGMTQRLVGGRAPGFTYGELEKIKCGDCRACTCEGRPDEA